MVVVDGGRVVRLHFKCRAELPLGSTLRVTGSTLWAPNEALETSSTSSNSRSRGSSNYYASSIEMVTSPDTYPIWTTRTPVVIHIHPHFSKPIQHHYYRYLVVTPGAATEHTTMTTTDDDVPVMEWEDPFQQLNNNNNNEMMDSSSSTHESTDLLSRANSATSVMSASSSTQQQIWKKKNQTNYLLNLPFRTLDINVSTGTPIKEEGEEEDLWKNADDKTFAHYVRHKLGNNDTNMEESTTTTTTTTSSPMLSTSETTMVEEEKMLEEEDDCLWSTTRESLKKMNASCLGEKKQRIFFVCYHLPVIVSKTEDGVWNACWAESLLAKTEGSSLFSHYNAHWIGTVTTNPPIGTSTQERLAVMSVLAEMNCTPIFLEEDVQEAHYLGMCKQVLWPAFHNIDLLDLSTSGYLSPSNKSDWDQSRLDGWWKAYQLVNRTFAQAMSEALVPGDIMWVHDYHLSLLPKLLSDLEVNQYGECVTSKVFFLHIPFPTSQIFRELECGESILEGVLHADVVGFHAFDHARHFLNATKRILGLNYESLVGGLIGVQYRRKTVLVTMHNVSIEPRMVDAALELPEVSMGAGFLRQKHAGRIMIAGVDVAQRLSGICLKLLAFERLLMDYPIYQQKVVLVQKVLIPGNRHADEGNTLLEVRFLVKRIKDKFGEAVMDYQEVLGSSTLPIDQRLALWKASDVYMSTPIREGLNLLPLEYIYARKEPALPGVVIASEFAAVCSILNGALRVNPFDIQMTVTSMDKALTMEDSEKEGRRCRDVGFVSTSPSDEWTQHVLRDLQDVVHDSTATSGDEYSTSAYLSKEQEDSFQHLDASSVLRAYHKTKNRVIVLDFNGTIVLKEPPGKYLKREILGTSGHTPPPRVMAALTALCADPKNTVLVVSGDAQENVQHAISHIPQLGMAASNGACFVRPNSTNKEWRYFDLGVDWEAIKRIVLPILSKYTARTNGSYVKMTHSSIGWSYYSCDPEWGSLQAAHLVMELEAELRPHDVRLAMIKGIVEIVPRRLNKGLIVTKVLREVGCVDFILCMGDDIHDEKMFTSVYSYIAELDVNPHHVQPSPPVMEDNADPPAVSDSSSSSSSGTFNGCMYSFTAAVGKKASHATHYVDDAQDVANLLVEMSGITDHHPTTNNNTTSTPVIGLEYFA